MTDKFHIDINDYGYKTEWVITGDYSGEFRFYNGAEIEFKFEIRGIEDYDIVEWAITEYGSKHESLRVVADMVDKNMYGVLFQTILVGTFEQNIFVNGAGVDSTNIGDLVLLDSYKHK